MRCTVCRFPIASSEIFCFYCARLLPWLTYSCYQCGVLIAEDSPVKRCSTCLSAPPPFDHTVALFHYQTPVSRWIHTLKFQQKLHYVRVFSVLLAKVLSTRKSPLPQCILPVPLHPQRLKTRGYNQALEIAKPLSRRLKIPLDVDSCQRIKPTLQQSRTTSQHSRARNLKNAFLCSSLNAQHIAIVDDVMTTGNTAATLAHALKRAGAHTVEIWCAARTT